MRSAEADPRMDDQEAAQATLQQMLGQALAAAQASAQAAAQSAQMAQATRPDQRTSTEAVRNLERPKRFVCGSEGDGVANWPE